MLINLRNALMAGKRLPYDAEVEYLESTGTQWIDTGVKKTSGTTIDCTFSLSNTSSKAIFGARTSASSLDRLMLMAIGTYFRFDARYQPRIGLPDTTSTFRFSFDGANATMTNLPTGTTDTAATTVGDAGSLNIALFGVNTGGTVGNLLQGRIYSFKLYNNGTRVRDYIPVRKGTVGYLYDRVSGKLFGNAGTGDFVLGPDVVPVEYIESRSNHAQVIDTGFYANQNTKALITFEKLGADGWLFGSRKGSSSATDKFGIFVYQSPDGKISAQVGNAYIEPSISGGLTNRKRTIELSLSDGVIVDGETIATFSESQKSQTFTSTYPMALFSMRDSSSGFNTGIYCRVYAYQIFGNGLIARNFLPVRVGTDATSWEGAMMDLLTRRIYRNAGTGAFGYGGDLKYPIPAE